MKFKHISPKFDAEGNFAGVFIESVPFTQTIMGIASDEGCKSHLALEQWAKGASDEINALQAMVGEDAPGIKGATSFIKQCSEPKQNGLRREQKIALYHNKYVTGCIFDDHTSHGSVNRFLQKADQMIVVDLSESGCQDYNNTLGYKLFYMVMNDTGEASSTQSIEEEEFQSAEALKQFVEQYMRSLKPGGKTLHLTYGEFSTGSNNNFITHHYTYDHSKGFIDAGGKPLDYAALLKYMKDTDASTTVGVTGFLNSYIKYEDGRLVTLSLQYRWSNEIRYLQTVIAICACYAKTRCRHQVSGWAYKCGTIDTSTLISTLQKMMHEAKTDAEKVDIIIALLNSCGVITSNDMTDLNRYIPHIKSVAATFSRSFLGDPDKKHYDELVGDFTDPRWDDYILGKGSAPEDTCIRIKVADMIDTEFNKIEGIEDVASIKNEEILAKEIYDDYKQYTQDQKKAFIARLQQEKISEKDRLERERIENERIEKERDKSLLLEALAKQDCKLFISAYDGNKESAGSFASHVLNALNVKEDSGLKDRLSHYAVASYSCITYVPILLSPPLYDHNIALSIQHFLYPEIHHSYQ